MKKPFRTLNLAQKLTFITLVITVMSSMTILGCVYFFLVQLNNQFLISEVKEHEVIVERAFEEPLWSFDRRQIEEVAKSLIANNGFSFIEAVKVTDPSGHILFEMADGQKHFVNLEDYANISFTKVGTTKISKAGHVLGSVQIAFTTKGVIDKYRGPFLSILFFSLMITGLTCFWINVFFNRLLTVPLEKVLAHVKELKNAKFETHHYSGMSAELQDIGHTLNYAAALVKKRNDDLKHHSENLEKMVAERSAALEEQTLKNINSSRLVAVGEVASGFAHEINNPLTVINGQLMKLERQIKNYPPDEQISAPIQKINLMINRIVKIINGLKLISRDGQSDPMASFTINNMVEEIKLLTEMKIKALNIKLDFITPESEVQVYGREVQISQVLVNLINNAVDAISLYDDSIEKWIKIEITEISSGVEFRITDSGKGIPKEVQEKMMKPFYTTKGVGKGTGLGLSISKGIINDHGGEFYYNPACPNTQFVITLCKYMVDTAAA